MRWTPRPASALRAAASVGDEGLALAGPHLRDLALVEHDAADELDVEVTHPERPLHGLAGGREDLGQGIVEGLLQPRKVALVASLGELPAALGLRGGQLVLGRLLGRGIFRDLGADGRDPLTDLAI